MNSVETLSGNTTFDIALANGSTVSYTSNNTSVLSIDNEGNVTVTRPAEGDGDATVVVTYSVSLNDLSSITYTVSITVKENSSSVSVGAKIEYIFTKDSLENKDLILNVTPSYIGFEPTKGLQIGSSSKPVAEFQITENKYDGGITKIIINVSVASNAKATVSVSVGEVLLICGDNKSINITKTATSYTFESENSEILSGPIVISISENPKAFYIKSIQVNE